MGRGKGGSTSHEKRTPGGIRTSSKMSQIGEIEAKRGVLGDESLGGGGAGQGLSVEKLAKQNAEFQAKIADQDKDRRVQLTEFWNKYVKLAKRGEKIEEPDIEVLRNDIERWLLQSKRKNPDIKPLSKYASHIELHDAMKDYRTAAESEREKMTNAQSGRGEIERDGDYEMFDIVKPETLTELAHQTAWCTKDAAKAKKYLKFWDYRAIMKNGEPIAVLKKWKGANVKGEYLSEDMDPDARDAILSRSDIDLIRDFRQKYVTLLQEDADVINKQAKAFGMPGISDGVKVVDRKEVEAKIEGLIDKAMAEAEANPGLLEKYRLVGADNGELGEIASQFGGLVGNMHTDILSKHLIERMVDRRVPVVLAGLYTKMLGGKRSPQIEAACGKNPRLALAYSQGLGKRYPGENRAEVERAIVADGAWTSLEYASIMQGRFKMGEDIIAGDLKAAVAYARGTGNGEGFPGDHKGSVENRILQSGDPDLIYEYSRSLKKRWFECEEALVQSAIADGNYRVLYSYAQEHVGKFEDIGDILLKGFQEHAVREKTPWVEYEENLKKRIEAYANYKEWRDRRSA